MVDLGLDEQKSYVGVSFFFSFRFFFLPNEANEINTNLITEKGKCPDGKKVRLDAATGDREEEG